MLSIAGHKKSKESERASYSDEDTAALALSLMSSAGAILLSKSPNSIFLKMRSRKGSKRKNENAESHPECNQYRSVDSTPNLNFVGHSASPEHMLSEGDVSWTVELAGTVPNLSCLGAQGSVSPVEFPRSSQVEPANLPDCPAKCENKSMKPQSTRQLNGNAQKNLQDTAIQTEESWASVADAHSKPADCASRRPRARPTSCGRASAPLWIAIGEDREAAAHVGEDRVAAAPIDSAPRSAVSTSSSAAFAPLIPANSFSSSASWRDLLRPLPGPVWRRRKRPGGLLPAGPRGGFSTLSASIRAQIPC